MSGLQQSANHTGAEGVDHYAWHLARFNRNYKVTALEDICDGQGGVLVHAGQSLDERAADRIIHYQQVFNQKLPVPIAQQVQIGYLLGGGVLFHRTYVLLRNHPDLAAVHNTLFSDAELGSLTVQGVYPGLLWQKLTVLEQQLPEQFDEAVFCGWFSALLASQLNLDAATVRHAYMAGLLHDIGVLNLPDGVLNKSGRLSPADWRIIRSHVNFSRRCLEQFAEIPAPVVRAVAEHHERCDGSGYPNQSRADALSRLGRVLGLADTLQAIRFKQFPRVGRCLYDAIPYLQMNGPMHGGDVVNAAITLLRNSGLQTTRLNPSATVSGYARQVLRRARKLATQIGYLEQILQALKTMQLVGRSRDVIETANQVHSMITHSGLTRAELLEWLGSLQGLEDDSVLGELNELDLMLNELTWQVGKLMRNIDAFFETGLDRKIGAAAHGVVAEAARGLQETLGTGE